MSDLDDFKATYFDECSELLLELEEQFAAIEEGDRSSDRLNAVFRAIHSIKGGGGAFGFQALVAFAHAYETLLDHVRDGRVELSDSVAVLCIRANDIVADFVAAAKDGTALEAGYGDHEKQQFDALTSGDPDMAGEPLEEFDIDFVPVMVNIAGAEDDPSEFAEPLDIAIIDDAFEAPPLLPEMGAWTIRFTPHSELYARANDPLLLFRELATLGETNVRAIIDEVPPLNDFEPFGVYCSWEITLRSETASEAAIAEVFEFVEGNCDLEIVRGAAPVVEEEALDAEIEAMPSFAEFAAEPAIAEEELELAPVLSFAELADSMKPVLKAAPPVMPTPLKQAAAEHHEFEGENDRRSGVEDRRNGVQSIRVDLDKIDRVVNMVGELVITQSMLTQQMDETLRARYQELVRGLEVLAQTTRGLQDSVMSIRAQPVKTVFSRMPRLVRELATKTGKKIRLETIGENTEIDKTIIEQLSDPLTHMIRNSADHGIESPEKRLAAGKTEGGAIRLSAEQAGGNILIAVEDDGGGINRERVLQVARDRGVVGPEQTLSDDQIDQLIFAPGFSTAEAISDISGRGVGMDVVLSNIKKIGGSVHVKSWPGKGTRMTLRLPLTLAVLDVMLVKVAGSPYVIPLSSIVETIQCARAKFSRMPTGGQVLQVRGEYVQVVDLASRFAMTTDVERDNRFVVLCEAEGGVKVALIVDDIIGQQQVVIKSLEENFQSIEGIAGGTILGDGNVALIVDVQGLKSSQTSHHKSAA
ncbi:chemotaxis protein CheA [Devosia sp. ZB163]|uniref:chemotaxis protein CheW n=1 Tax=Devosia sp. ZB163 TaxID=3025938 RepID=UPI0023609BE8|nr:chemotaxis protein CheA [Devosia sp. ZB163]MDC9822395.1 chemotaxis protein CheA [Devosia sp. ZB163]